MTQTTAVNIPLEILISRFENHASEMALQLSMCRWWQWKRRYVLVGALAAYRIEVDAAYALGGGQQEIWLKLAERASQ